MQENDNSLDQESQKINQDFETLKNEINQAKKILSDLEDSQKNFSHLEIYWVMKMMELRQILVGSKEVARNLKI
jgi:uncharacterized protein YlxW (UPF0749 family)